VRKVDIAHSRQTVPEAMNQLKGEIKSCYRRGETHVLVVHGFGASGVGGAIKAAVAAELPELARTYGFKAYSDKDRIPRQQDLEPPRLNPGCTLLIFRRFQMDGKGRFEFRPNFRNLRSRVKVRAVHSTSGQVAKPCAHSKKQLVWRGPGGDNYQCHLCGKTVLVPRG
jgi:hypothetical protein